MLIFSVFILLVSLFNRETIEWHMIDVNYGRLQGDANLIINNDSYIMIDGGAYEESEKVVVPYLQKLGISSIDHFFISHAHFDHYEGLEAIQNNHIKVKNVYFSMPPEDIEDCCYSRKRFIKYLTAAKNRGAALHEIAEGFMLPISDDSSMEVLYAHKKSYLDGAKVDVNDLSLVMRWSVGKWKTLFTGDLNQTIGAYLANDERMKADILKVPHHGINGIAPVIFFKNVGAKLKMIPGQERKYFSDKGELVRKFSQENNIKHCVNGINGTIVLKYSKDISLVSERPNNWCMDGKIL